MDSQDKFDQWAVVELMGHRKLAGKVSEQVIAGHAFLRIDVPEVAQRDGEPNIPAFTQFYGPSSVYSLTPTSEEIARRYAGYHRERPVQAYELKLLVESVPATQMHFQDNGDEL